MGDNVSLDVVLRAEIAELTKTAAPRASAQGE